MTVTLTHCRICGDASPSIPLFQLPSGNIVQCSSCLTVFRANLKTGTDYVLLYQNEALMETPFYASNKLASDPHKEPLRTYLRGLRTVQGMIKPGRLLDIGCSYGAFMVAAQQQGWETMGVELSEKTARYAREQRGLNVFTGFVEEAHFPDAHFQLISLWDVIEHFEDPIRTLRELTRILAPGGIMLIFTINQKSLLNSIGHLVYWATLKRWKRLLMLFYDMHHNFFFTPETLCGLVGRVGRFDVTAMEFASAHVRRWHTVPLHPIMMLGSDVIDWLSVLLGRRYRIILYVRKIG
jgi:2-polyprenyl-3-methyl-5-hydroxy-6-metoxy-1,4-benzoquinol methylase